LICKLLLIEKDQYGLVGMYCCYLYVFINKIKTLNLNVFRCSQLPQLQGADWSCLCIDPNRTMVLDNVWHKGKKDLTVKKALIVVGKKMDLEPLCLSLLCRICVSSSLGVLDV